MPDKRTGSSITRRAALAGGAAGLVTLSASVRPAHPVDRSHPVATPGKAFERERFVSDCIAAHQGDGMAAVHDVLSRAVSDHRSVLAALGGPTQAGLDIMLASPSLTIFAAHWTPQMNLLPHDHNMAALIGIYTGREDNILWRRGAGGIEAYQADCLFEGDVAALPSDAIHSVTNPLLRFTGGIHIYDGDFFDTQRHQWDPETLEEGPSDGDSIREIFARENIRYNSSCR